MKFATADALTRFAKSDSLAFGVETTSRREAEARERLRTQYVDVPPHRMFVRFCNELAPANAIPVLLVHGLVVSSRYMVPTLTHLAHRFPVYAPDLPGFGHSTKPKKLLSLAEQADVLAEFLDVIRHERVAVLANSQGCQIAVELALRHPDRVRALVLQAPTTDPEGSTAPRQVWRWLANGHNERLSQVPLLLRDYWDAGPRRAIGSFRQALRDPIAEKLGKVRAPALVVRGTRDPICPQPWAEQVAKALPRGRLVVIPGGPHTLNYARPLELARVVTPFLRSLG